MPKGVVVDSSGNVSVTGHFNGSVNFGGTTLTSKGVSDVFVAQYKATGQHLWSKAFGGTSNDNASAMAVDSSGNITVTGTFYSSASFGGSVLTSKGAVDIFVARYNSSGQHLWSTSFGSTTSEAVYGVAAHSNGDVTVTGYFQASIKFGATTLTSKGSTDIFVAHLKASSGAPLWAKAFGNFRSDSGYGVTADSSGNITVTGYFAVSAGFGGTTLTCNGNYDYFLAQFKSTGQHIWSKAFTGPSTSAPTATAVDSSGNVTVAGAFQGSINLGGTTLVSKGDGDIFVAQYKSTGQHLWSKSFGGTKYDAVRAVAVDSSGNITVTGEFSTTVNFGGSTLTTKGSYDIFLAQFKSTGQHLWSKAFGSINAEYARAVAVDSSGNIALTGSFFSSVNFGGTALISKGSQDVFLALFKSGGQHIWSKAFGGISYDDSFGLAVGNSGDVTVTGVFQKTMNLGGSNMTSKGGYDVFLAQFKASNGQHLWSKAFGGASHDYGRALALDGSGNLTLTGSYVGSASFGGATLAAKGSNDMFLAQYKASNGQHIWSKALGGSGNDQPMAMAVDGSGNLTVTGYFTNSGNFGGQTLTSKGSWEIFLARYKSTGQHIWSRAIGGIGGDYAYAVAVDKSSNSILFGRISEVVDFGLGAVTSFGTMFAAQYAP